MIKHKLIDKGSVAHALISSVHEPNILMPVKVTIKDIKFDEYNPLYLVKIVKFYDNINFLKKYFIGNYTTLEKDGEHKYFHKNGQLRLSESFDKGIKTGAYKAFYEDGTPKEIFNYIANS